MNASSPTLQRVLRPAQPVAIAYMLGQLCTGTLVVTFGVLLAPHLDGFTLALLLAGGTLLLALGVRDAERDRILLPRDNWPSFRSRAIVWASVILFTSSPLVFTALLIDRFVSPQIAIAIAVGVSVAGWGFTAYRKLRFDQVWLPRPKDEEIEAGLAAGALVLTAVLVVGWLLVRIGLAFGNGPLPSSVGAASGVLLSLIATVLAGGSCLTPLLIYRLLKGRSPVTLHVAIAILYVPVCLLLLLPMDRWGHPLPSVVPVYAAEMVGRIFLAAVFAFGVMEYLRTRRS